MTRRPPAARHAGGEDAARRAGSGPAASLPSADSVDVVIEAARGGAAVQEPQRADAGDAVARLGTTSSELGGGPVQRGERRHATSSTSSAGAERNRRRASTPAIAASTIDAGHDRADQDSLVVADPNCRIAHSLSGVGVRSITCEPTASTGDEAGSSSDATRWPVAIPVRVARTPNRA